MDLSQEFKNCHSLSQNMHILFQYLFGHEIHLHLIQSQLTNLYLSQSSLQKHLSYSQDRPDSKKMMYFHLQNTDQLMVDTLTHSLKGT